MAKSSEAAESTAGFILVQDSSPFFEESDLDEVSSTSKSPISCSFGRAEPILASGDWSEEEIQAALQLKKLTLWQKIRLFFCA